MQAQNKIEIGDFGIQNSAAINIGGKGAQINIGAIDDPDVSPSANTVITIGKRATLRNTQTNLQGNIITEEARFESLGGGLIGGVDIGGVGAGNFGKFRAVAWRNRIKASA
jgi:hypothetical protein